MCVKLQKIKPKKAVEVTYKLDISHRDAETQRKIGIIALKTPSSHFTQFNSPHLCDSVSLCEVSTAEFRLRSCKSC